MEGVRIMIRQGGGFLDVSDRKLIIWGAGSHSRCICAELQLSDIALVVDSSPKLEGTAIVLYGQEYTVSNPDILNGLPGREYFILVGSTDFRAEILKQIHDRYGTEFPVCSREEDFLRCYTSLEAMLFLDPWLSRKVCAGNISTRMPEYFRKLNAILKEAFCGAEHGGRYIPIRAGVRISFLVLDEKAQKKCVVHFPTRLYREEYTPSDEIYVRQAYECKEKIKPDRLIKIYEDKDGFEIEKYAETDIVWHGGMIRLAIEAIRQIHCSRIKTDADRNPWNRLLHREAFLEKTKGYFPRKIKERIHGALKTEIRSYEPKLCHGDFHKNNIVLYRGKLVIVDWEWIGMSDPFLDVCHFINSLQEIPEHMPCGLDEGLALYLQRPPSERELRHARAISIVDLYLGYCFQLRQTQRKNEEIEEKMARLLDGYEERYKCQKYLS